MAYGELNLKVEGAEKLVTLGKSLKDADPTIKKELKNELERVTKPTGEAVVRSMAQDLPQRGGLGPWVGKSKVGRPLVRFGGRRAGVDLKISLRGHDVDAIERGRLRHPVFGNRHRWVTQEIESGIGQRAFDRHAAPIGAAVMAAINRAAEQIVNSRGLE